MKAILCTLAACAVLATAPVMAQTSAEHAGHHADPKSGAASTQTSDGEVRKIDKATGKITIKHGPIASLNQPPMTMVFGVKDPALLNQLKEGDKIKFVAEASGSAFIVTQLDVVR